MEENVLKIIRQTTKPPHCLPLCLKRFVGVHDSSDVPVAVVVVSPVVESVDDEESLVAESSEVPVVVSLVVSVVVSVPVGDSSTRTGLLKSLLFGVRYLR